MIDRAGKRVRARRGEIPSRHALTMHKVTAGSQHGIFGEAEHRLSSDLFCGKKRTSGSAGCGNRIDDGAIDCAHAMLRARHRIAEKSACSTRYRSSRQEVGLVGPGLAHCLIGICLRNLTVSNLILKLSVGGVDLAKSHHSLAARARDNGLTHLARGYGRDLRCGAV